MTEINKNKRQETREHIINQQQKSRENETFNERNQNRSIHC